MTKNISVLIIEGEKTERESLKKTLEGVGGKPAFTEAEDIESGYLEIQKTKPLIVIFGLPEDSEQGLLMIERITREFPGTNVLVKSKDKRPETIIKSLKAGAKDFFMEPMRNGEMCAAIEKIIKQNEGSTAKSSKIISVFSGKGGVGTTMIAANLALNLTQITSKPVTVVDLDLQFGNINMYLDVRPFSTLSDVIKNFHRLDHALLQGMLAKHPSGVYVLSAPKELEDCESIKSEHITRVLTLLKDSFDYIIVDTPRHFDEYNLPVFDLADTILLVCCPLIPSLHNTQRCLSTFKRIGYNVEKIKLVVNRCLKPSDITIKEIEETLNCPVFWMIPNDFVTVTSSINRGEPISSVAPRSGVAISLMELANTFAGDRVPAAKKKGWKLFGF